MSKYCVAIFQCQGFGSVLHIPIRWDLWLGQPTHIPRAAHGTVWSSGWAAHGRPRICMGFVQLDPLISSANRSPQAPSIPFKYYHTFPLYPPLMSAVSVRLCQLIVNLITNSQAPVPIQPPPYIVRVHFATTPSSQTRADHSLNHYAASPDSQKPQSFPKRPRRALGQRRSGIAPRMTWHYGVPAALDVTLLWCCGPVQIQL